MCNDGYHRIVSATIAIFYMKFSYLIVVLSISTLVFFSFFFSQCDVNEKYIENLSLSIVCIT